jgi:hypothetical protein
MQPLPEFGTAQYPLRASSLPMLLKCPLRQALLHLGDINDSSGPAADTGNLAHTAIERWHKNGKDAVAALEHMRSNAARFPLGDPEEAERYFTPYANDPKNQEAEVVYAEVPVAFTIQEAVDDPYGPIYVRGTLDQIRRDKADGRLYLWDVKTGSKYSGWDLLHVYAAQQAAYVLAASETFNTPVYPGGIIRPYGYRVRGVVLPSPDGVFWHHSWDIVDCHTILADVRNRVRDIRRGTVNPVPGEQCNYCPAGGLQGCLPLLRNRC